MPAKRTLAERAKWKIKKGWHIAVIEEVIIEMADNSYCEGQWMLYISGAVKCDKQEFHAPNLAAAKARAIELVQERIRELAKLWEVPNV